MTKVTHLMNTEAELKPGGPYSLPAFSAPGTHSPRKTTTVLSQHPHHLVCPPLLSSRPGSALGVYRLTLRTSSRAPLAAVSLHF